MNTMTPSPRLRGLIATAIFGALASSFTVVCAAAEAIDVTPRVVRPALLAAVTRARQLGLTLETLDEALRATATAPGTG